MIKSLFLTLFILLLGSAAGARAEAVVVVNAASAVKQLSHDEVTNIFLGRYRRLPNGESAIPIDQPEGSTLRVEFYRKLVNKDVNEINAYWSRLIFSGRTSPPVQAANFADVMALLTGSASSVAYLDRSQVDKRVRIVFEFPP